MMSQVLTALSPHDLAFPDLHNALTEPNGLLAVGGDLSWQRLVNAYKHGVFPWFNEQDPLLWWSPNPRAILSLDDIHINKTLKKFIRKQPYQVTINHAFDRIINICADAPFRDDDTWILDEMVDAYQILHRKGYAHSVEVWEGDDLVGGLYGVAINGLFSGESMFYLKTNASKIALIALGQHLKSFGVRFIDCQIQNPFLQSMGAIEIERKIFIQLKEVELNRPMAPSCWQPQRIDYDNKQ